MTYKGIVKYKMMIHKYYLALMLALLANAAFCQDISNIPEDITYPYTFVA